MAETVNRLKLALFCGAGFSVGAGLPTMLTFAHALRNCLLLDDIDKRDFDRIQVSCAAMTAMTHASSRNIEDLASLLSVLALSRPDFCFVDCERTRTPAEALALLNRCIRGVFSPEAHDYRSNAGHLLWQLSHQSDLSIITTNYDLNIEIGAAIFGIPIRPSPWVASACLSMKSSLPEVSSLYKSTLSHHTTNAQNSPIGLYKLHGSVNWYLGPLEVEDRWRVTARETGGHAKSHALGSPDAPPLDRARQRLVPPTVIKADGLADLAEEWQYASNALGEADAIWFIGYSFPETDAFMRYFLAGALQRNTRVRQIVILDPAADVILSRTASLFGSAELNPLLEPIPVPWERFDSIGELLNRSWKPLFYDPLISQVYSERRGRQIVRTTRKGKRQ